MPANTSERIRAKIRQYAAAPQSLERNVSMVKGERGCLRLRVGDWRVVFVEDAESITIVRIAPRARAYD